MSNARSTREGLSAAFHQSVRERVAEVVAGDPRITTRRLDGQHVVLYNGRRGTPPFKISASRPASVTLLYLDNWLRSWGSASL